MGTPRQGGARGGLVRYAVGAEKLVGGGGRPLRRSGLSADLVLLVPSTDRFAIPFGGPLRAGRPRFYKRQCLASSSATPTPSTVHQRNVRRSPHA